MPKQHEQRKRPKFKFERVLERFDNLKPISSLNNFLIDFWLHTDQDELYHLFFFCALISFRFIVVSLANEIRFDALRAGYMHVFIEFRW